MKHTFRLGHLAGIEVRAHISYALYIPFILYLLNDMSSRSPFSPILLVAVTLILLGSILLHELAHALVARRYGIGVTNIVLWILGGFTFFAQPINRPRHDILVSLAGPLANLVLAGLLWPITCIAWEQALSAPRPTPATITSAMTLAATINAGMLMNALLGASNLIPLYPLDGGRVLRALIHAASSERKANRITLLISLLLAGLGLVLALRTHSPMLLLGVLLLAVGAGTLSPAFNRWLTLRYAWSQQRGDSYLLGGDYDRAIAHYTQDVPQHPDL